MTPEDLKLWMAAHGYTYRSLADALGVSRSTVERWRSGEHPVRQTAVLALERLATRG